MTEGSAAAPTRAARIRNVRTPEAPGGGQELIFRDGKIVSLGAEGAGPSAGRRAAPEPLELDGGGDWLLPGWIDLQVNDIEWLAGGLRPPQDHRERIRRLLRHQAAGGATGLVLATLAAPEEEVIAYLRGAAEVRAQAEPIDGAFLGVLVEGTFMNPALPGAHNPAHVRRPDRQLLDRFLETGGLRMLNVAPEASEDSLQVIEHAARREVVVGCGHAKPSGERVREAVAAGLSYVIHLGNGPTGSSLKGFGEGGLLEEALRNDRITVTLILDGVHLDRRLVRDILARKEPARVVGVSDAGFGLGPPSGEFSAFGIRGTASGDGRYLRVLPAPGAPAPNPLSSDGAPLFGSAITMREVFENTLNWLSVEMEGIYHRRHPALPFLEALRTAVAVASGNPARLVGERGRGLLAPGARADLVLASIRGEPGSYRVEVKAAWVSGLEARAASATRGSAGRPP